MPSGRRAAAIHGLFFVSGAAGLVYQVVWSRLLNEVFGVTTYAVTAVLATFLGGLALGSWYLGPLADRARSPLRVYGILELGIAASALVGSWTARAFDPIHVWAASRFAPDSVALILSRCALAALVVVPPTFLMGGTLPALTRAVVGGMDRMGRKLGFLYALNTAGAVAGSIASGFVLIRAVGLHPTLWIAVAINVIVGGAALWLGRGPAVAWTSPSEAAPVAAPSSPPRPEVWVLVTIALSGVASLALEVIWTRMLVLVVGTSTYAFVTMLSAFLVGIAIGSALVARFIDRVSDVRTLYGWVQAGIAATSLVSLPLLRSLMDATQQWVDGTEFGWLEAIAVRFGMSFIVMLVPTTLMGMTLPLAVKIAARGVDTLGARLGRVYGANAAGNIIGAVTGGFVLLPLLGMQRSIGVLVMLNLAAAAWALLPWRTGLRGWRPLARALPASIAMWGAAAFLVARHPSPLPRTGGGAEDTPRFYREGNSATVKVIQAAVDGRQLVMTIDGVVIGQSSAGVDKKQQVLAHFPFVLLEHTPQRILTIGLGTGILAGEMVRHRGVARVEVVEISHAVVEGAALFERWNGGVLHDPRVEVIEDDGVNYLKRAEGRYDAIVSDGKSKSGHAGNAVFFSEEYYRDARAHLAPDGAMLQWVPLDLPGEDLKTIVRTFEHVFPHTYLWMAQESAFLVGMERPLSLNLARAQRVLDAPEVADLRRYGWNRAAEVAALLVADETTTAAWLGPEGEVNSLEHPVLEFYSARAFAEPGPDRVSSNMEALIDMRRREVPAAARGAGVEAEAQFQAASAVVDGSAALARGDLGGVGIIRRALSTAPRDGLIRHWGAEELFRVARNLDLDERIGEAVELYRTALAAWPEFVEACNNIARDLALERRDDEAMAFLRRAIQLNPDSGSAHLRLAELLLDRAEPAAAIEEARAAARLAPRSPYAHAALGLALSLAGDPDGGVAELLEASRLRPAWPVPLARAALVLAMRSSASAQDLEEAARLARRAVDLGGPRDVMALETLAATHAAAGQFGDAAAVEQRAVEAATASGDARLAAAASAVLERYRRGVPLETLSAPPR